MTTENLDITVSDLKGHDSHFFVAKNVLKKKPTYTTNIASIPEMKVLLKEAFCGVFKTNVTRYMVQLIKKNSYEKLLESLPLLY